MWRLIFLVFPLSFLLTSCYSIGIGLEYLGYVGRAQQLDKVENPTDKELQLFARVKDIKRFGHESLGLRPTKNFSSYLRLDRKYLTAVVSATEKLSFTDYTWAYPVVGRLPYRGYFKVEKAKKLAEKLKKENYDVWLRPVDAFSSLGYAKDPLFSYMVDYSEYEIADLVLHESFHATVFIKRDTQFNESLANIVGRKGAELYLKQKYGASYLENYQEEQQKRREDSQQYRRLLFALREKLEKLYKSSDSDKIKLEKKSELIAGFKEDLDKNYSKYFTTDSYRGVKDIEINNAYISLYALYYDPSNFLDEVYRAQGSDLKQFIEFCKKMAAEHGKDTRQALKDWLAQRNETVN